MRPWDLIRNFCIIAHIDHGKSTLADRILLDMGVINERDFRNQVLDSMDLERERGITIKASAVAVPFERDGTTYALNLIDTPGHVDFSAEVVKSLRACEGAILLVDASQGVEAQTVANMYHAMHLDLAIIPVINKIDLPTARVEEVKQELCHTLGCVEADIISVSAKTGMGVRDVLCAVVDRVPPPVVEEIGYNRAFVFDAVWDEYRGVVLFVRVHNGIIRKGRAGLVKGRKVCEVLEVGKLRPGLVAQDSLGAGDVGYIITNIKSLLDIDAGDTVYSGKTDDPKDLPGFTEIKPMVFCTLFPSNAQDFEALRESLDRLNLNDSSFTFQPENLGTLGQGFRAGFLGLLHLEIIQQRLEREYGMSLIRTAPSVKYRITRIDGTEQEIRTPAELPDPSQYLEIRQPFVNLSIICPAESIGAVMKLAMGRSGVYKSTEYFTPQRVLLVYDIPLAEIIFDFFNKLKNCTRGYGTMDYEVSEFRPSDLVKLEILVHGNEVDPFTTILPREKAVRFGREILLELKRRIPRHLFKVPLQAVVDGKVVAREDINPVGKNVTAKCYGGDITRKRKLLEKQKEGKKRMKNIGSVEVPQEAFLAILDVSTRED
ncbi:MAG: translation elongation factor 4 [Planctomycetota bacterium]